MSHNNQGYNGGYGNQGYNQSNQGYNQDNRNYNQNNQGYNQNNQGNNQQYNQDYQQQNYNNQQSNYNQNYPQQDHYNQGQNNQYNQGQQHQDYQQQQQPLQQQQDYQQQDFQQQPQQPEQPLTSFLFQIKSSTQGEYNLELTHQDSVLTLYNRVQERFRAVEDSYLKYNDQRLPNSPALISQYISVALRGNVILELVTKALDEAISVRYMCEKCGHTFHRSPDDAIECPQNTCRHGILFKCRKEGTITQYDCR